MTGPITDDATTEDETADHTQASDDEGEKLIIWEFNIIAAK